MRFDHICISFALAGPALGQRLNKSILLSGLGVFNQPLIDILPSRARDVDIIHSDYIDPYCAENAYKADWPSITTYYMTYPDSKCNDTIVLCRHNGSSISESNMLRVWSRLPLRMQQYAQTALWLPSSQRPGGFLWAAVAGPNARFWGGWTTTGTYLHELGHLADSSGGFGNGTALGTNRYWTEAVARDDYAITEYGEGNAAENIAELVGAAIVETYRSGGVASVVANATLINDQLTEMKRQAVNSIRGNLFEPNRTDIVCRGLFMPRKLILKSNASRTTTITGAPPTQTSSAAASTTLVTTTRAA